MLSDAAAEARAGLEPERVRPGVSFADERAEWDAAVADAPAPEGVTVALADVAGVPCDVIEPDGGATKPAAIVFVHGGGLVAGSPATHRPFAAAIALAADRRVIVPAYRLLPEHSPDDALDDVAAVANAVADEHGLAAIGGDSSGAALALTAVASGATDEAAVFALCGAFDLSLGTMLGSGKRDDSPTHTVEALESWRDRVFAEHPADHPLFAALDAELEHIPALLIQAAGRDLWRQDSVELAERAADAGARVELQLEPELWHVWHLWTDLPETREAVARLVRFVDSA